MQHVAALSPHAQDILSLARANKKSAEAAMSQLSIAEQVALVCEAPLSHRAELLELAPLPEAIIPELPEAELVFTVKAVGLSDAAWILEYATSEQFVACVDLDVWRGTTPDRNTLDEWIDAFAEISPDGFIRAIRSLDPELVVLFLKSRITADQRPPRDDQDWEPPDHSKTLDGQFYFTARRADDDIASLEALLRALFQNEYWTYFRMMQGVIWELESDNEEWSLRWRTHRLQDLGFPPWDEAMSIYRYLRPEQRARVPKDARPLAVGEWHLPVWMPGLPSGPAGQHPIFDAIAGLEPEERRSCFYAFVALSNKVAVADAMELSDADSTPRAIDKAARFASAGLDFVAAEQGIEPIEVLRAVTVEHLFNVGANLDPVAARPVTTTSPPRVEGDGVGDEDGNEASEI